MPKSSIWFIDRVLSGATNPDQSGPGSNANEGVLCIHQNSSITGTSLQDCLASCSRNSLQRGSQFILQPRPTGRWNSLWLCNTNGWFHRDKMTRYTFSKKEKVKVVTYRIFHYDNKYLSIYLSILVFLLSIYQSISAYVHLHLFMFNKPINQSLFLSIYLSIYLMRDSRHN